MDTEPKRSERKGSPDWSEAQTLQSYICKLVERDDLDTPEFLTMVRVYGKPKIDSLVAKCPPKVDWEW